MINHNALASRLNKRLYKDTDNIEHIEEIPIEEISLDVSVTDNINKKTPSLNFINYIEFIVNIICFGYATQVIFQNDWSILGVLAVGYSINFIINKTLSLFS